MPVHAIYDVLSTPPPRLEEPFALAARRITAGWLARRRVDASPEDLRLATSFLERCGFRIECLPGREIRLVSERGRATVLSREALLLTAIRSLVLDVRHAARLVARAA
jgi:hypothetical protein